MTTTTTSPARIAGLAEPLKARGYHPHIPDDEPWRMIIRKRGGGMVHVHCKPRPSDQDRLWFFFAPGLEGLPPGIPIVEADGRHDADAIITICAKAGPPPEPEESLM